MPIGKYVRRLRQSDKRLGDKMKRKLFFILFFIVLASVVYADGSSGGGGGGTIYYTEMECKQAGLDICAETIDSSVDFAVEEQKQKSMTIIIILMGGMIFLLYLLKKKDKYKSAPEDDFMNDNFWSKHKTEPTKTVTIDKTEEIKSEPIDMEQVYKEI